MDKKKKAILAIAGAGVVTAAVAAGYVMHTKTSKQSVSSYEEACAGAR